MTGCLTSLVLLGLESMIIWKIAINAARKEVDRAAINRFESPLFHGQDVAGTGCWILLYFAV